MFPILFHLRNAYHQDRSAQVQVNECIPLTCGSALLHHFPQRDAHALIDEHDGHFLQQRHTQQNGNAPAERAKAWRLAKHVNRGIDQSHEEEGQRRRDGQEDPFLARFGVGDGQGENGCESEDGDERSDEESHADFCKRLREVPSRALVKGAGLHAANDAEDDSHKVEEFGYLYMYDADERVVGLVDARCYSAQQAPEQVKLAFFVRVTSEPGSFFLAVRWTRYKIGRALDAGHVSQILGFGQEYIKIHIPERDKLKGRDGDTYEDGVADVKGQIFRLVDSSELEARAEDAS